MKLILLYLLTVLVLSARATRRGRPLRSWPLLVGSFVVASAFLSYRFV